MRQSRLWMGLGVAMIAGFLATVATYYHPPFGFTPFLTLPANSHDDYELPAVKAVPHWDEPSGGGYDGQFYAQIAVEPLLKNPAIDKALDLPGYRARRILFSWTAYLIGFGKTSWILEVFALQNVVVWLVFAWLLTRWFPLDGPRSFVLWSGCLLTAGMLSSVRYALVDAPATLILTCGVIAAERDRPWLASIIVGIAGLARETSLLGVTMLSRFLGRRSLRSWALVGGCAIVMMLPLLIWMDYLRSIYRDAAWQSGGNVSVPFAGMWWKTQQIARDLTRTGLRMPEINSALALIAFVTQLLFVVWCAISTRGRRSPWVPIALSFAALGLCAHQVVWDGSPGAVTRVTLPLAIGFNVLAREASWTIIVLGNLGVIAGVSAFVFRI